MACRVDFQKYGKTHYPTGEVLSESIGFIESDTVITRYFYRSGKVKSMVSFKDDTIHGRAFTYYEGGQIHSQAEFIDGKQHGPCIHFYLSGNLRAEDHYVNGVLKGESKGYYESGKLFSIWKHDPPLSIGRFFHESGDLRTEVKIVGLGNVLFIKFYDKEGRPLSGSHEWYYDSGKIDMKGAFEKGSPVGLLQEFYESGAMASETHYVNGKPHGVKKEYCETGELEAEIPFVNGKVHGDLKLYNIFYHNTVTTRKYANGCWIEASD
jgi:antitoxin component YwqK of YwqJK toxin-antitoxin module